MTAQEFHQYLEAPDRLYGLALTELQELALKYPYSPNLRLLLLLKAKLEQHPAEDTYLERCAAASFDRGFLYDLLQELESTSESAAPLETDVLELRELDQLNLEPLTATISPPAATAEELATPPEIPIASGFSEFPDLPAEDPVLPAAETLIPPPPVLPPARVSDEEKPPPPFAVETWADRSAAFLEAISAPAAAPINENAQPERPERFTSDAQAAAPPSLRQRLGRIRQHQQSRTKDPREEVDKIARRSLVAHEAVASETLARLLVQQEQYQNAIKMYRRLILLYPEKKTIFAGLIKDLKEKL